MALLPALLFLIPAATAICPFMCDCIALNATSKAKCERKLLTRIPDDIPPDVQELYLDQNDLSAVAGPFFTKPKLKELRILSLTRCELTTLSSDAFEWLHSLDSLNLSQNKLISLPQNLFDGLLQVKTVHLENNKLESLEANVFHGLETVETIDLRFNQLKNVDSRAFSGLAVLQWLWLSDNHLAWIPPDTFDKNFQLEKVTLTQNPWRCDCNLRLFGIWYHNRSLGSSPQCLRPQSQRFKHWNKMSALDFACPPTFFPNPRLPRRQVCRKGATISIECLVDADPEPKITWKFRASNKSHLQTIEPHLGKWYLLRIVEIINPQSWTYILTIKYVERKDEGSYFCIASNPANTSSDEFSIEISETEEPTSGIRWHTKGRQSDHETEGFVQFITIVTISSVLMMVLLCCSGGVILPKGVSSRGIEEEVEAKCDCLSAARKTSHPRSLYAVRRQSSAPLLGATAMAAAPLTRMASINENEPLLSFKRRALADSQTTYHTTETEYYSPRRVNFAREPPVLNAANSKNPTL